MIMSKLQSCNLHDTDLDTGRCLVAYTGSCPLCAAYKLLEAERCCNRVLKQEFRTEQAKAIQYFEELRDLKQTTETRP